MKEKVFEAALAGLLHDIGKFLSRASPDVSRPIIFDDQKGRGYVHAEAAREFIEAYVPSKFHLILDGIRFHHQPERLAGQPEAQQLAYLVRLADQLAAGETNSKRPVAEHEAALVPILARVELLKTSKIDQWHFQAQALDLDRSKIFPVEDTPNEVAADVYHTLWQDQFQRDLDYWKSSEDWGQQSLEAYFTTLLALLQRYLSFVPASSPWPQDEDDVVWPDVSLFSHLKVTAAIAACLVDNFIPAELMNIDLNQMKPLALLVRGDLSGIQGFIYRITQLEADAGFDHVAKRLRGRSFYLSILGEVLADWLTRQMGLPATNVLFVGGGQFDLLIPVNKQAELQECLKDLEDWLLDEFYGELGFQIAPFELRAADFADMRPAYKALAHRLEAKKSRKWRGYLDTAEFFISAEPLYHRCRVCHLTPLANPGTCPLCRKHAEIGRLLPHTSHFAFVYGDMPAQWPTNSVTIPFRKFGVTIGLLTRAAVDAFIQTLQGPVKLAYLNPTETFVRPAQTQLEQCFGFLANVAPVAEANLHHLNMQPVNQGDVLHFDAIAELSSGAKRIGILKADVDHLGLLFREGLAPDSNILRPTLSRVISLSAVIDLFFAGWLNHVCRNVFQAWQDRQSKLVADDKHHDWYNKVTGLFYVMYSGGDDLFIVGPWDETLKLTRRLQNDFEAYACGNPNLSLSAGIVQVKPHYPVQRFATLVDEAENQAKQDGRHRVTVFGQSVPWRGATGSFEDLLELGYRLRDHLEANEIPRTLLHDIGRLYRIHKIKGEDNLKPMWTPRLFYTMARRLSQDMLHTIGYDLFDAMAQHTILVPVSYASLVTRKE